VKTLSEKKSYSINEICNAFQVSTSGYRHHFSEKMTSQRANQIKLIAEMKVIHHDLKLKSYGSPRMTVELQSRGFDCSENTVAKLMQQNGLVAKGAKTFKPPKTTTVDKTAKYSPNRLEKQSSRHFGEVLIADITYIPTKEGWLYLSVVIDLYSRAVLGYETSGAMPASIVTKALNQAVNDWSIPRGLSIFHSDRGCQYTSHELRRELDKHAFLQSMSAKGNCYDNATCESFFSSFKRELLPECGYFNSRQEAKEAIFEHIESFYNTRRRHTSLNNLSPYTFIKQQNQLALSA